MKLFEYLKRWFSPKPQTPAPAGMAMPASDSNHALTAPDRAPRLLAFLLLTLANLFWAGNWVTGRALRDAFDPRRAE